VVLSGSSTTKTSRHDIAEILLRVALSTKNHPINYWMAESHLQKAIMSMSITVPKTRMISKIAIVPIDLEDCRPSGALECLLIFMTNFLFQRWALNTGLIVFTVLMCKLGFVSVCNLAHCLESYKNVKYCLHRDVVLSIFPQIVFVSPYLRHLFD
jgi:hypothetical protein